MAQHTAQYIQVKIAEWTIALHDAEDRKSRAMLGATKHNKAYNRACVDAETAQRHLNEWRDKLYALRAQVARDTVRGVLRGIFG